MKKSKLFLISLLLLSGCNLGGYWTPEQQGTFILRCQKAGLDYGIGDWGQVFCKKPASGTK